jgi:Icc protein
MTDPGDKHPCVVQFTDTHIYGDPSARLAGIDSRESFDAVVAHARAGVWPPNAVLVTGDLAMDGSSAAYMWLRERLAILGAPVYCIPGNHDEPPTMREIMQAHSITSDTCVDIGAWRVLLLDTFAPGRESGELGRTELECLSSELSRIRDRHVLIALHHPPVAVGSPWMDAMGLADAASFWEAVNDAANVRCVLWGHVHQNYDSYRGGIRLLGSPSTCVQFAPRATRFALDARAPAYRRLELRDDGQVDTVVRRIAGRWW